MTSDNPFGTRCPSAPATVGSKVIGMVGEEGRIAHFASPLEVDEKFLENLQAVTDRPEAMFRFSSACAENKCSQWNGSGCGLVDRVVAQIDESGLAPQQETPPCVIRAECRWFLQKSYDACRVCVYVVTDTQER